MPYSGQFLGYGVVWQCPDGHLWFLSTLEVTLVEADTLQMTMDIKGFLNLKMNPLVPTSVAAIEPNRGQKLYMRHPPHHLRSSIIESFRTWPTVIKRACNNLEGATPSSTYPWPQFGRKRHWQRQITKRIKLLKVQGLIWNVSKLSRAKIQFFFNFQGLNCNFLKKKNKFKDIWKFWNKFQGLNCNNKHYHMLLFDTKGCHILLFLNLKLL